MLVIVPPTFPPAPTGNHLRIATSVLGLGDHVAVMASWQFRPPRFIGITDHIAFSCRAAVGFIGLLDRRSR